MGWICGCMFIYMPDCGAVPRRRDYVSDICDRDIGVIASGYSMRLFYAVYLEEKLKNLEEKKYNEEDTL